MHKCRIALITAAGIVFNLLSPVITTAPAPSAIAGTQAPWRTEFDSVCARTEDSMALGAAELRTLINWCDELKTRIGELNGPERKIYSKRLQMCRDLYAFVLESKENKEPAAP